MLTLALEDFTWDRPAGRKKGYEWVGEGETMRLVPIPGVPFENYQPHAGLYREFAGLREAPEDVLRFANRYGSLEAVHYPDVGESSHGRFTHYWLWWIRSMKSMVALADAVSAGDLAAIRRALGPLSRLDQDASECERITHDLIHGKDPDPEQLAPDEVARVAAARLWQPVLESLSAFPAARWNQKKKSVDVRLKYWGLREFMYGQLCIALVQGRKFQQCAACGRWFQLAPGVNRADRSSCSASCRFTLYRRRKQQAQRLHEQGKTVRQIAKEVGSTVEIVRKWITRAKE